MNQKKLVIFVAFIASSCSATTQAGNGEQLFERYCDVCHQLPGKKDMKRDNATHRLEEKLDYLRLSGEQKKLLKDYIRSLR